MEYFNPHSRKGSDVLYIAAVQTDLYFNPHSRKGSDDSLINALDGDEDISIHTPARGVTVWYL